MSTPPPEVPEQTLWDTIKSVAASFFGVQSSKNRQRDFTRGKAAHFIVVGIVATILFIGTIVLVVLLTVPDSRPVTPFTVSASGAAITVPETKAKARAE